VAREIASALPRNRPTCSITPSLADVEKVFRRFRIVVSADRPARSDLAKAPKEAWLPVNKLYPMDNGGRRRGYRHELASTLALFAVLQRHAPDHPALLGPWRELLNQAGMPPDKSPPPEAPPNPLEQEILVHDTTVSTSGLYESHAPWQGTPRLARCPRHAAADDYHASAVSASATPSAAGPLCRRLHPLSVARNSLDLAPAAGSKPPHGAG